MEYNKEKPIQGLKVKYGEQTYESITYFSISNWDGKERVSFTNKENENKITNITCSFSDIEIIGKLKNE
jgi:hypothetical protein